MQSLTESSHESEIISHAEQASMDQCTCDDDVRPLFFMVMTWIMIHWSTHTIFLFFFVLSNAKAQQSVLAGAGIKRKKRKKKSEKLSKISPIDIVAKLRLIMLYSKNANRIQWASIPDSLPARFISAVQDNTAHRCEVPESSALKRKCTKMGN